MLLLMESFCKTKGVFLMRNNDEKKRQKLINKLIFLNVFNKEDQQLYKLSLSKLQYEYRRFNLQNHPHGEFGSIQFV